MCNFSILIIDNNRSRSQSLKMLLEFMDFNVDITSQLSTIKSTAQAYNLIIYGDKTVNDFLLSLRDLTNLLPQIPFVLLENDQPFPLDSLKQQYPLCLGVFKEPFKQDIFLALIADIKLENTAHINSSLTSATSAVKVSSSQNLNANKKTLTAKEPAAAAELSANNSFLEKTLIGQSSGMKQVRKLIQQVASSNANVLILGESGTGKEVVAHCVHQLSKRQDNAYVPVNCGAIPADLLESELFGHEKGAFTGAINARQGRFELAQSGTLFLDEIGDMPLAMQVKILRILQEKMFERVGGNKSIIADVRILAATHRNLEDRVSDGSFREDLFYRLNVFPIEIPPLKDRVSDLPLLIQFLNKAILDERDEQVIFSEQAMASIFLHAWPGNIRELGNLVERLAIMFGSETIQYEDLPEKYQYDISDFDYSRIVQYESSIQEKQAIEELLINENNDHNVAEKDQLLEINLQSEIQSKPEIDNIAATNDQPETNTSEFSESTQAFIDLPDDGLFDLKAHLGNLEQTLIEDALSKSNGVVAHAAKRLNIRRTTLVEKMRKYAISGK
jgi:sigma-54 dependent transcriptional regulator, flagellar regulatory protein